MRLTHCDRCGKLFTPEHDITFTLPVRTPLYDSKLRVKMVLINHDLDECYLDLCAYCRESFLSWWSEKVDKENM